MPLRGKGQVVLNAKPGAETTWLFVCTANGVSGVLASFGSTWHNLESRESREPIEKMLPWDSAVSHFLSDWLGRVQPIVGGAIPELVGPGSIRNQAQQAMRSKPVSSTPPWPLHQLLPPGSCPAWVSVLISLNNEQQYGSMNWINKHFPPQLAFWSWCFSTVIATLTKTLVTPQP